MGLNKFDYVEYQVDHSSLNHCAEVQTFQILSELLHFHSSLGLEMMIQLQHFSEATFLLQYWYSPLLFPLSFPELEYVCLPLQLS